MSTQSIELREVITIGAGTVAADSLQFVELCHIKHICGLHEDMLPKGAA